MGNIIKARPAVETVPPPSERAMRSLPCNSRGEVIGSLDCRCRGKPNVYACALHSRCVLEPTGASGKLTLVLNTGGTETVTDADMPHVCETCAERSVGVGRVEVKVQVKPLPAASNADRLAAVLAGIGPGSQLWRLLETLGIAHQDDCECLDWAERMNDWGPAGCREHRAEIIVHMADSAKKYGWTSIVVAAVKSVTSGLAWRINPVDPYGSLVDEAIRRAEKAGAGTFVAKPAQALHPHQRPLLPADLEWISTPQLVEDALKLVPHVDHDTTGIIGVPRSGMIAAAAVAAHVHLPLHELASGGMRQLGAGFRGNNWGSLPRKQKFLLIDDSSHNGASMERARSALKKHDVKYAAVYTLTPGTVDCYARLLSKVHIFDWNIMNNGLMEGHAIDPRLRGEGFMFDFDGILCPDTPIPHTDANEKRVVEWLRDVRPMRWIPRFASIPYVVSFRLEKHRAVIEEWLRRWRIRVKQLILHPAPTFAARDANFDVIAHKAERYKRSGCALFMESCPHQSALIAKHAGKPVCCPPVQRFFFP